MDLEHVPPALADVVGPLEEAKEYERLRWNRRRGARHVGMAAVVAVVALVRWGPESPDWVTLAIVFGTLVVFLVLLWVQRRHPAWSSLFGTFPDPRPLHHDPGRLAMLASFLLFVVLDVVAFEADLPVLVERWLAVGAVAAVGSTFVFAARREQDDVAMFVYALAAILVGFGLAVGALPSSAASWAVIIVFTAPLLLLGSYRLMAPPRWLP